MAVVGKIEILNKKVKKLVEENMNHILSCG